ncbi:MAG: hypothetical protein LIO59_03455, partial [Oscillospiraceae bacterium]|nr:hypothetical protein [Oscillospiraceae bacterium]
MKIDFSDNIRKKIDNLLKEENCEHLAALIEVDNYNHLVNTFGTVFVNSAMEIISFKLLTIAKKYDAVIERVGASSFFVCSLNSDITDDLKN